MSTSVEPMGDAYRKVLTTAVANILIETGFDSVEKDMLETLTEMFQCLLVEAGRSANAYCELAGRTLPVVGDVVVALVNMGIRLRGIEAYAKRDGRQIVPMPAQTSQQKQLSLLQAGQKANFPTHIPNYLPALPDPHAYVRTPTHKQPVTEYEAIREKAATQKRDVEKALTKFLAKTSETHSLFEAEDSMFPLIAAKPTFPPYLAALNPIDQVFDFEELEYHYLVANRTEDVTSKTVVDQDDNDSNDEDGDGDIKMEKVEKENKPENVIKPNSATNKAILENPNIDNPYLRAATLPKRTKTDPMLLAQAAASASAAAVATANAATIPQIKKEEDS